MLFTNKNKNIQLILLSVLLAFMGSCSTSTSSETLTHAPVKIKGDKRYSLLNLKTGEVLFQDEYDNLPSVINEGVFYTRNKKNEYEYHRLDELLGEGAEKSLVSLAGGPYLNAGIFNEGIAIVVEKNERPKAIDENGAVVFQVNAESNIKSLSSVCQNDRIKYVGDNALSGFLNKKGEIVIPAQFTSVTNFKDGMARGIRLIGDKREIVVINSDGNVIVDFDKDGYIGESYDGDFIAQVKDDRFGIIDSDKEEVITFDKKIDNVYYSNGHIFYNKDDKVGVLSDKGEQTIRAKYESITFLNSKDSKFIALSDDNEFDILDEEGNKLYSDDGNAFGLNNNNYILFGDQYGELKNDKNEDLCDDKFINNSSLSNSIICLNSNDYTSFSESIESDYFDFDPIIKVFTNNLMNGELFQLKLNQNISKTYPYFLKIENSYSGVSGKGSDSEYSFDDNASSFFKLVGDRICSNIMFGSGFSDNEEEIAETEEAEEEGYLEEATAVAEAEVYEEAEKAVADEEKTEFKDVASELGSYQSYLEKSIDISNLTQIRMRFIFSEYLKEQITKQVTTNGYFGSYMTNKVIGMKWNETALLKKIDGYINISSRSPKSKESLEKVESELKIKGWKKNNNVWVKNNLSLSLSTSGDDYLSFELEGI